MVSGDIKSTQVTASSSASSLYSPGMARLNSSRAWCAGNDTMDQFIQVCQQQNMVYLADAN